jgi:transposase-like protein
MTMDKINMEPDELLSLIGELKEIKRKFGSEEACREALFRWRWAKGYKCPECGHTEAYFHKNRRLYQCKNKDKNCRYQASITAGTIFHRTRVPLQKWFRLIFLMLRNVNAGRLYILRETLEIRNPKTFWVMRKKISEKLAKPKMKKRLAELLEVKMD